MKAWVITLGITNVVTLVALAIAATLLIVGTGGPRSLEAVVDEPANTERDQAYRELLSAYEAALARERALAERTENQAQTPTWPSPWPTQPPPEATPTAPTETAPAATPEPIPTSPEPAPSPTASDLQTPSPEAPTAPTEAEPVDAGNPTTRAVPPLDAEPGSIRATWFIVWLQVDTHNSRGSAVQLMRYREGTRQTLALGSVLHGATVIAIEPEQVIFRYPDGRQESLILPEEAPTPAGAGQEPAIDLEQFRGTQGGAQSPAGADQPSQTPPSAAGNEPTPEMPAGMRYQMVPTATALLLYLRWEDYLDALAIEGVWDSELGVWAGLRIVSIPSSSPFEVLGFQAGDVILAVNEMPTNRPGDLDTVVAESRWRDGGVVRLVRDGEALELHFGVDLPAFDLRLAEDEDLNALSGAE